MDNNKIRTEITVPYIVHEGDAFIAGYGDVNYGEGKTDG